MDHAAPLEDGEVRRLRLEVEDLRSELEKYKRASRFRNRATAWLMVTWLGSDIKVATQRLDDSLRGWQQGKSAVPVGELTQFVGAVAARFTRVGLFRVAVAVLITAATLWFSVAQVLLLRGQNKIAELQSRAQLTDFVFRLKAQREATLMATAESGQIWVLHSTALMYANDTFPAPYSSFRQHLKAATGHDSKTLSLIAQCDFDLQVFSTADKALRNFELTGSPSAAKWDLEQAEHWWRALNEGCTRKSTDLYTQLQEFEKELAAMNIAKLSKSRSE